MPLATPEQDPDAAGLVENAPSFDVVRVEPNGTTVVAGKAEPGSQIVLRVDGAEISATTADANGNFAAFFVLDSSEAPRMLTMTSILADQSEVAAAAEVALAPTKAPVVIAAAEPQTAAPDTKVVTPEAMAAATPTMPLIKIYLVEDSPVIRDALIATLEELVPVRVVGVAEDETTALRWLRASGEPVDLVIVDLFLLSGSGLDVLRAVQTLPQRPRMVVLTNYASPYMRRECLALGAERVFDKSNEIEALVQYCAQLAAGELPCSEVPEPA